MVLEAVRSCALGFGTMEAGQDLHVVEVPAGHTALVKDIACLTGAGTQGLGFYVVYGPAAAPVLFLPAQASMFTHYPMWLALPGGSWMSFNNVTGSWLAYFISGALLPGEADFQPIVNRALDRVDLLPTDPPSG